MLEILKEKYNQIHEKGSFKGIGPGCKLVLERIQGNETNGIRL